MAMHGTEDLWLVIIFIFFVGFIFGFFVRASLSQYRRHIARKQRDFAATRDPRFVAAKGEPRHDGRKRGIKLLAVVTAFVIVSCVIVLDHFKGPLFPDVFYCLNDNGAQTTRMCTGRVPPD
jgi:hypothetical protein